MDDTDLHSLIEQAGVSGERQDVTTGFGPPMRGARIEGRSERDGLAYLVLETPLYGRQTIRADWVTSVRPAEVPTDPTSARP